jgi:hypothetical protein
MMISLLAWTIERFQGALLIEALGPDLLRRPGEIGERKPARTDQFLDVLGRAVGA